MNILYELIRFVLFVLTHAYMRLKELIKIYLLQDKIPLLPLHELEAQLMEFYELRGLRSSEVLVGPHERVHVISPAVRDSAKPDLVFLPGYMGTSLVYARLFRHLQDSYNVFSLDLPGMGLSTIDKFSADGPQETINYFLARVEACRVALRLERFVLLAHSLGAYIAVQYTIAHTQHVSRLLLLSPAGVTNISEQANAKYREAMLVSARRRERYFIALLDLVWKHRITPSTLYQHIPILNQFVLDYYLCKKIPCSQREKALWIELYHRIFSLNLQNSESAAFNLFFFPRVCGRIPCESQLTELFARSRTAALNFPKTAFFYGQHDWMNREGANILKATHKDLFSFYIVPGASHHIHQDSPFELSTLVAEFLGIPAPK